MEYDDAYKISKFLTGMIPKSETPTENFVDDVAEELSLLDENTCTYLKYLLNALTDEGNDLVKSIHRDINNLIDHETEVFDPICDGPVEHAEGMSMAQDFINKYFKEQFDI